MRYGVDLDVIQDLEKLKKAIDCERWLDAIALSGKLRTKVFHANVIRNQQAELLDKPLRSFAATFGLDVRLQFGPYDDSLSFGELNQSNREADAQIIIIDYERYSSLSVDELATWLISRIVSLRSIVTGKIILVDFVSSDTAATGIERQRELNAQLRKGVSRVGDCFFVEISKLCDNTTAFFDQRLSDVGGSRLSRQAFLLMAKTLGLSVLLLLSAHR